MLGNVCDPVWECYDEKSVYEKATIETVFKRSCYPEQPWKIDVNLDLLGTFA